MKVKANTLDLDPRSAGNWNYTERLGVLKKEPTSLDAKTSPET